LATEGKRDYYQVLGVARTAADHEIRAAFQKLVTEFHAAGKPKTTDDVEWLRLLRRAYDVLSDKNGSGTTTSWERRYRRFQRSRLATILRTSGA
jgi:preprotein translocase subunit Sec63